MFFANIRPRRREKYWKAAIVRVVGGVNIYFDAPRMGLIAIGLCFVGCVIYFVGSNDPLLMRLLGAFIALVGVGLAITLAFGFLLAALHPAGKSAFCQLPCLSSQPLFWKRAGRQNAQPMIRLSVNVNKVALLRNSRRHGVPDLLRFAALARQSGADGITVHPRPDERHIRRDDVLALAELMEPWRPHFELNIEGYPDERLLDIMRVVRPEQCTFVPDPPGAFTSEEGWRLDASVAPVVTAAVSAVKQFGCRAILFVDPDPEVILHVPKTGADGVEIYTGSYAAAVRTGQPTALLNACAESARRAVDLGLVVNVGHDLNLRNLPPLVAELPMIAEASIGHELTADALEMGFGAAVGAYKAVLRSRIN